MAIFGTLDFMPIGTTSRYNPATGERQEYQFEYAPASQMANQGGMQFDMRKAMEQLGVKQAEQAMIAATRFQGQRGYQQELQKGTSPDQALAKWAPLMFFGGSTAGAGSMISALQPQPQLKFTPIPGGGQAATYGNTLQLVRPPTATTPERLTDAILKSEQEARNAIASGNSALATQLQERAKMLRDQSKGQEVTTGYDDQGRPIVRVGKGGGDATVATQSRSQQKLQKYENAMELINQLQQGLKAGHVGVAGVGGEYLWDKGLVQLSEMLGGNQVADPNRVSSRVGLKMLSESLMREVSDDSRFSNMDRNEITKALPSTGAFESLSDAQAKLATIKSVLQKRGKVYGVTINEQPLWALDKQEILDLFKEGKIDRTTAKGALIRFH